MQIQSKFHGLKRREKKSCCPGAPPNFLHFLLFLHSFLQPRCQSSHRLPLVHIVWTSVLLPFCSSAFFSFAFLFLLGLFKGILRPFLTVLARFLVLVRIFCGSFRGFKTVNAKIGEITRKHMQKKNFFGNLSDIHTVYHVLHAKQPRAVQHLTVYFVLS